MRSLALFVCLAAGLAHGGEFAVLTTGARLHADRHEIEGGKVRLFQGPGFIELDASRVRAFDLEEVSPTLPVAPAGATVSQPVPESALSMEQLADAAAERYGLPPALVRSVIAAESAFQPHVVSHKGAIGLMQLMPGTARDLGVDPHDPAQNIDAGTRYLKGLLEKYNYHLWHALAAYNAGPGAVDKYRGVPPYRETINYVRRIDRDFKNTVTLQPQP